MGGSVLCCCARPRQCSAGGVLRLEARVRPPALPLQARVRPGPSVSARGQLCLGLRLRRSRCITEREIPPDGGLGLLLFSRGAVPLARPILNIKTRTVLTR